MKLLRVRELPDDYQQYAIKNAPEYLCVNPESGFYWIDIYRKDRTPKRLVCSTKTKLKGRAIYEAEQIVSKWLGENIKTGDKRRVLIEETCNEVIRHMEAQLTAGKIRTGTLRNAKVYISSKLKEEFGQFYWDQWTDGMWLSFAARFQAEKPGKTLYNYWKHMSMLVNHAHKYGLVMKKWDLKNPDPIKKVGRVLSEKEKSALFDSALPSLRDQMLFAMTMGMRFREHLKLTWNRVNFDDRTVILRAEDTKTKKARTMRMSPQVYAMLLNRKTGYYRHGRSRSDIYVFPSRGDLNRPCESNKSAWKTAKRLAGIQGRLRYHDLRHTFLTECAKLVREGHVSVVIICAYAGLSIKTFERVYLHLDHNDTAPVSELIVVKLRDCDTVTEVKH